VAVLSVVQERRKGGRGKQRFQACESSRQGATATPTANLPKSRLGNYPQHQTEGVRALDRADPPRCGLLLNGRTGVGTGEIPGRQKPAVTLMGMLPSLSRRS